MPMSPETARRQIESHITTHDGRMPIDLEIGLRHIAQDLEGIVESSAAFERDIDRFIKTLNRQNLDLITANGFSQRVNQEIMKNVFY